ncbi:MAG: TetR family transcriptional regulator [Hyphomicrobiaceae bacterium]
MMDISTPRGRIVAAALRIAAERPWPGITLRDIAEAADLTLSDLAREFAGKSQILVAFNRAIDDAVLRNAPKPSAGQTARDSLFEAMMARFDALTPYRAAVRSIVAEPVADGRLLLSLLTSQRWMLAAAGIDTDGVRGKLRIAGLTSVYAGVFRTWLSDDDPGLARTMAALDRRLRSGERTMDSVERVCAGAGRAKTAACDVLRGLRNRTGRGAADAGPADAAPPAAPAAG